MTPTAPRLLIDPPQAVRAAARALESAVFQARFGLSEAEVADSFAPYEDLSLWFVVLGSEGEVLGGVRALPPSGLLPKTLGDASSEPWHLDAGVASLTAQLDLDTTWDVASIARRPGRTQLPVAAALLHCLIRTMVHEGATATTAVLDTHWRRDVENKSGLSYRPVPDAVPMQFLGSESIPVYAPLAAQLSLSRRLNPEGYRMFVLGGGLGDIQLPPAEDFSLPPRLADPTTGTLLRGSGGQATVIDLTDRLQRAPLDAV